MKKKKKQSVILESYINKNVQNARESLEKEGISAIIIGNGDKIIDQFPKKEKKILKQDLVLLKTNGEEVKMPNMIGWSSKTVQNYFNLIGLPYTSEGYGFVSEQSVPEGTVLGKDTAIAVKFTQKFGLE